MASTDLRRIFLEITGDSDSARRELTELRQSLAQMDRQNAEATVTIDAAKAEARLAELEALLEHLGTQDQTVSVLARTGQAEVQLAQVQAQLAAIGRGDAEARVEVDTAPALAKVAGLKLALTDLDGTDVDPRIRINVDQAKARLSELEADFIRASNAARDFEGPRFGDQGQVTDAYAGKLRDLRRTLKDLQTETNTTERAMRRWAAGMIDPADNLNRSFRGVLGVIKQVNPVIQGLSLIIFTSLIPALAGVVASAAGAAAGIAALGPAALAAGSAMAVGLIAVTKSISEVLKLRQQRTAAQASETRQATQADERAEAAARAVAEAERSVRDAKQQRETATRAVAQAEEQAARDIASAQDNAIEASNDLKDATSDAYRAMADAARDAKAAVLDLADAQLSTEEAALATREAKRELDAFAKSGSKALQTLGKKFEDVSYDPKKLAGIIRSARTSGAIDGSDADKLEELTLRYERAKLRERQAAQGVTEAELKLKDARKKQADFTKQGIAAYKPYTDAVDKARDAEAEYRRLLQQGISQNPQVIAAREALRDANERIVASTQRVKDTLADQAKALKGDTTGPMALYEKSLAKLTAAQRNFLDALDKAGGPFKKFRDLIADPILNAGSDVIRDIASNLSGANGWAAKLGEIGAKNIRDFVAELKGDPQSGAALKLIGSEALKTAEILGGEAFRNFVRLMRNFAAAGLPLLNEGLAKMADSIGRAADRTNDWGALREQIRPLLRLAGAFAAIIRQVIGAMVDLGRALEPVFTPFLRWIAQGIAKFREFTNSAKGGARLQQFFKDTLPLVKTLITTIVSVGKVLLQAFQVIAPILQPVLAIVNALLGVLSWLLEKVLLIPAPVRSLVAVFIPFGAIVKVIGGLVKLLARFPGVIGLAFRVLGGLIGKIRGVVAPVGGLVEGVFFGILSVARRVGQGLSAPFRLAVRVIGGIVKGLVVLFAGAWDGIRKVFEPVVDFFETIFKGVADVVGSIFNGIVDTFKGAINILIGLANGVIKAINAIPNIGPVGIPDIPEIPKLAKGGVATKSTLANIGEAGDEAVIPLKTAVLKRIGAAISTATPGRKPGPGSAPAGGPRQPPVQHFHITSPPGTNPDAVATSKKIGRLVAAEG